MPLLLDDIPVRKEQHWDVFRREKVEWPNRNTPFPHPSWKMGCWDDFSQYLLKQQAGAFFNPDGYVKWTSGGRAGFMLLHLHLSAGGGEAPARRPRCLPARPPPAASGRQMVAAAGSYHAVQKVSFLSAPSRTGVNLLVLLGRALVAVQVSGSTCNRPPRLHHTVKEAIKQAQLYRALSVLSGRGFNFIHMCPQLLVFSLPIYDSFFFFPPLCTLLDFAVSEWRYLVNDQHFGNTFKRNKKKRKTRKENQQSANKAYIKLSLPNQWHRPTDIFLSARIVISLDIKAFPPSPAF